MDKLSKPQIIDRFTRHGLHPCRGVSLSFAVGIIAFAAVAVPLGEAPTKSPGSVPTVLTNQSNQSIKDQGVAFSLKVSGSADGDESVPLYTRRIHLEPSRFLGSLARHFGVKRIIVPPRRSGEYDWDQATNGIPRIVLAKVTPQGDPDLGMEMDAGLAIRRFVMESGVDFSKPGRYWFYTDGEGVLLIRATLAEIDQFRREVQLLLD